MAICTINNESYDIDGILFDKDGTLVDFRSLWLDWADKLITTITSKLNKKAEERENLAHTIGVSLNERTWDPKGPLCIGSNNDLNAIISLYLYQQGMPWNEAVTFVAAIQDTIAKDAKWEQSLELVSGLGKFLSKSEECFIKLGVVTADDHNQAMKHLQALNIDRYFSSVIGHDQVEQGKPFPDMVEKACLELRLQPERTLMIGDSNGDMMLGKNSGMIASIGIVSDPSLSTDHLKNADQTIRSFDEIQIKL